MRKTIFASGEIYHVYNIGVEKRPTFIDKRDYDRALLTMNYYHHSEISLSLSNALKLEAEARKTFFSLLEGKNRIVDILGYCFMPNHFHFLLKQLEEEGIVTFTANFSNSYAKYFNLKNKRIGHLFKGAFNAVRVENNEQFIHVLRYIHINPVVSYVIREESLEKYPYTSFFEYCNNKESICTKELLMDHFKTIDHLKSFTFDQIDYGKKLEQIKHLTLE